MTALIELQDARRDFHVGAGLFRKSRVLHAVNGVSLQVAKGEVMAIVGESGCGKTTLARMILGLLPASAGTIRIDGRQIAPRRCLFNRRLDQMLEVVFDHVGCRSLLHRSLVLRVDGRSACRKSYRPLAGSHKQKPPPRH